MALFDAPNGNGDKARAFADNIVLLLIGRISTALGIPLISFLAYWIFTTVVALNVEVKSLHQAFDDKTANMYTIADAKGDKFYFDGRMDVADQRIDSNRKDIQNLYLIVSKRK